MMKVLKDATVQEIIRLADAARVSRRSIADVDFSKTSAKEEIAERLAHTPQALALREYLKHLPKEQMAELVALMWLGRGDCAESRYDYPELVEFAKQDLKCTHPVKTVRLRGDEDGSVQATTVVATVAA